MGLEVPAKLQESEDIAAQSWTCVYSMADAMSEAIPGPTSERAPLLDHSPAVSASDVCSPSDTASESKTDISSARTSPAGSPRKSARARSKGSPRAGRHLVP